MNNNEEEGTTNTTGWYTKNAKERVTSKYEEKSKTDLKSMTTGNKNQSGKSFDNFSRARTGQMAQGKSKKIDFNVKNYDIEELAAILKFEYIPLNKGIIQRRIYDLKKKFKQQKYQNFLVMLKRD